jgi:hypothetical protein
MDLRKWPTLLNFITFKLSPHKTTGAGLTWFVGRSGRLLIPMLESTLAPVQNTEH